MSGKGSTARILFDTTLLQWVKAVLLCCATIKLLAVEFVHPEIPVTTTNGSTARFFFDDASAMQ